MYESEPRSDLSDIYQVFEVDDIFTLWIDTWKFVRMGGDHTRYCIDGMTRFSFKYWSWLIDRLIVSHRFGFIRYLDFLQGITRVRVQIQTEISVKIFRRNSFLKLTLFLVTFLIRVESHVVYWFVTLKTNKEFSLLHHSRFKKDNLHLPFIFIKQRSKWVWYSKSWDTLFYETQVY